MTNMKSNVQQAIAGKYIYYNESEKCFCLDKGIIYFENGVITKIEKYDTSVKEEIIFLDEDQVIYPGFIDIHTHPDCNMIQMFSDDVIGNIRWDNRHEWRAAPGYINQYRVPNSKMIEKWDQKLCPQESDLTVGDMMGLFSEMQALAGGTVLIQQDGNDGPVHYLDNHNRASVIRSSSAAQDLGRKDSLPMKSIVRMYAPIKKQDPEDPSTFMPPMSTDDWGICPLKVWGTDTTYIDQLLNDIKHPEERKAGAYLIHMAEGRSGNNDLFISRGSVDAYTRLEADTFIAAIKDEIEAGNISYEDVKNAGINLIHACGFDLADPNTYAFIKNCGISLSWSPVSNLLLYKDTPKLYDYLDDENINVNIGSDWSPSGSKTIWDECKFVLRFLTGLKKLDENGKAKLKKDLYKAATINAAKMTGSDKLGNIGVGKFADMMILDTRDKSVKTVDEAMDALYGSNERSITAVYVGGKPAYADKAFCEKYYTGKQYSWVKIQSTVDELTRKYYNMSGIATDEIFNKVFATFVDVLEKAGYNISRLRSTADIEYLAVMKRLAMRLGDGSRVSP